MKSTSSKSAPKSKTLSFPVLAGTCLGYKAYRGFAPLADLTRISEADIFDQEKNRLGTQRNLSVQHARRAHEYVASTEQAFYPEMILNVRDLSYVSFKSQVDLGDVKFGTLVFKKDPEEATKVVVSRLDGNHRLWFADGHEKGMDQIGRAH